MAYAVGKTKSFTWAIKRTNFFIEVLEQFKESGGFTGRFRLQNYTGCEMAHGTPAVMSVETHCRSFLVSKCCSALRSLFVSTKRLASPAVCFVSAHLYSRFRRFFPRSIICSRDVHLIYPSYSFMKANIIVAEWHTTIAFAISDSLGHPKLQ